MSLEPPEEVRSFQRKLYEKAKREPDDRFYLLAHLVSRPGERFPAPEVLAACGTPPPRSDGRTSPEDRARLGVTKPVKTVTRRAEDADLGRHLATAIRTGRTCGYEPEPGEPRLVPNSAHGPSTRVR